jgi:CRISPR/Cas system CSM-associated protein Csm2 small subunit
MASKEEIQQTIREKVLGKIVPEHTDEKHSYRFLETGKLVDSITTKLVIEKPHLRMWYAKKALEEIEPKWKDITNENREAMYRHASFAGTRQRDAAGDIGTAVHEVVENYLNLWITSGTRPEDIRTLIAQTQDYRVFAGARSAEKLFKDHAIDPVWTELLVGDEFLGIAGTLDFLALFENKLMIGDWKTSNNVNDDYAIQVSAYRHCFERMTGIKTDGCLLVQLSKSYDHIDLYDIPNTRAAFARYKHIASIYDWMHNGKKKLIKIKPHIEFAPTP